VVREESLNLVRLVLGVVEELLEVAVECVVETTYNLIVVVLGVLLVGVGSRAIREFPLLQALVLEVGLEAQVHTLVVIPLDWQA
jgi:hypothetical protein